MSGFDPFAGPAPRWRTIEAHRPFLDDLAAVVVDWLGDDRPEVLSDAIFLLPNRRAARAFGAALGRAAGDRPVLLPQVRPLGDLEEDEAPFAPGDIEAALPPAIGALRRRFELARLVRDHLGEATGTLRALEMGEALGRFLDSCWIEEVADPDRLAGLVEADMAEHWRASARLLDVALTLWPARLAELGLMDPQARRVALLRRLAEAWTARPPTGPVVAAGSTGTVPAAAAVLAAVAAAPMGCVVLPGLDRALDPDAWAQVDHQHPQGAMKRLLDRAGVPRDAVMDWRPERGPPVSHPHPDTAPGRARGRLIAQALTPPARTADWRTVIDRAEAGSALDAGLVGLSRVEGRTEEASAGLIAVMMRQALETPGRTVALVTPDQDLARRVQARLSRWGLAADSSAGEPLARTPVGALVALVARLAADGLSAVGLLALLKHPAVDFGQDADARRAVSDLERYGLRGPAPDGFDAVRRLLDQAAAPRDDGPRSDATLQAVARARALLVQVESRLAPWLSSDEPDVARRTRALVETLERLTAGPDRAWRGAEGEAAARLLAQLIAEGEAAGPLSPADYADLLDRLMTQEVVRAREDTHPRLKILGAIEARLDRADLVILAGLEEGVWPSGAGIDPFLSRPMREALGLPSPERRVGLQAHDFAQAAAAPEVVLVHSERRGGQPAVKSRWLWRLETLLGGANRVLPDRPDIAAWASKLDGPPADRPAALAPAPRPRPTPPIAVRPRKMSVTRIDEWVRDPYATYARFILKLTQMARPDERVDARIRGSAVHAAVQAFAEQWPTQGARDGVERFADLYLQALAEKGLPPAAMARERPLAHGAGRFIVDWETGRRRADPHVFIETRGETTFDLPGGPFTLFAKADRLEVADGRLSVIDFKTGGPPSGKQVKTGFAGQLPLTAAIIAHGGFPALGRPTPDQLVYVQITGRETQPDAKPVSDDEGAAALAERHLTRLFERVSRFDDPATPYLSRTAPETMKGPVSDYDHLARVGEWSTRGEGDAA